MTALKLTIRACITECEKHILMMDNASEKMQNFMPLTISKYKNLTRDQIGYIDQFLFRFIRMQDAMGRRLFESFLKILEEDISKLSFLDVLNRLEQLNILEKTVWIHLRNLRNQATHEYPQQEKEITESLNQLFAEVHRIKEIFQRIKDYLDDRDLI